MPSDEYRLWEIDIVQEERKARSGSVTDALDESDTFDDFVIVERLDMKKYNKTSKLIEEEKIKDSGSSQCLIARSGMSSPKK